MAKVKTPAELLAEKLMSGDTAKMGGTSDLSSGRKKAAKEWVNHFLAVTDFIKSLPAKPTSIAELEELLVESWEVKASEKDEKFTKLLDAF